MMGYFALQLTSQVSYEKGLLQKTGELLNFKIYIYTYNSVSRTS